MSAPTPAAPVQPGWPGQLLRTPRLLAAGLAVAGLGTLAGCADLGYYWQSVRGHLTMLNAARPVNDWLSDDAAPALLKTRLALAREIRGFAVASLGLPDNPSYHRYADLHRSAVVWNVVAAPIDSLQLKTWCFPVAGCVGYRGYFDEAEAKLTAQQLQADGLEVVVQGVPAYSTLGWMNWAGGDPLLSTFIGYPADELARMVFHELAHQVAYAPGDMAFNESFATAVERLGLARWQQAQAGQRTEAARLAYAVFDSRRRDFRALTQATRHELTAIYAQKKAFPHDPSHFLAMKSVAMEQFRARYAALKSGWDGYAGYDPWVARANNAAFGAQAAYDDMVPAFEALFARHGGDWNRFYDAVRQLAKLPRADRRTALGLTDTAADDKQEKTDG